MPSIYTFHIHIYMKTHTRTHTQAGEHQVRLCSDRLCALDFLSSNLHAAMSRSKGHRPQRDLSPTHVIKPRQSSCSIKKVLAEVTDLEQLKPVHHQCHDPAKPITSVII